MHAELSQSDSSGLSWNFISSVCFRQPSPLRAVIDQSLFRHSAAQE